MTLSFKTKIDGKPNFFIEKIWSGLRENHLVSNSEGIFYSDLGRKFDNYSSENPKIHTIREDKKDRWKIGNDIHFVINNRTKDRFQFAPILKCKNIQYISISYVDDYPIIHIGDTMESAMPFYWENPNDDEDGYGVDQMKQLVQNDGFDSIEDFFKWFNCDFAGKIIHWTDFSYCA